MIDRYTIKVNSAVSQKEIIKALNDSKSLTDIEHDIEHLNNLKAKMEIIGSGEAIERLIPLLNDLDDRRNSCQKLSTFVPGNALVITKQASWWMVGKTESL